MSEQPMRHGIPRDCAARCESKSMKTRPVVRCVRAEEETMSTAFKAIGRLKRNQAQAVGLTAIHKQLADLDASFRRRIFCENPGRLGLL
jgi:hypothetical protein